MEVLKNGLTLLKDDSKCETSSKTFLESVQRDPRNYNLLIIDEIIGDSLPFQQLP